MAKIHDMGKAEYIDERGEQRLYSFMCPGCGYSHSFEVPRWSWNGSLDAPTFHPSLLINKDYPKYRCHSFVTAGKIIFQSDCHHELANKTVEIPEWE